MMARCLMLISLMLCCLTCSYADEPTRVLVVIGPSDHPPGSHEVAAGGRLMGYCLEHALNISNIQADVVTAWPTERAQLDKVRSVVFIGDTFPGERLPDSDSVMRELAAMMARGCGIVCVHYATGLRAEDVEADGQHPLLQWMGGYFATRCKHHQSVARIYPEATITPGTDTDHPLLRGWKTFTVHDEPYIKNYFGHDGNRLAVNVTPIAVSMLPPEAPQREIVAWAVQRTDGGCGFGIVMPHFYRNWRQSDLRTLILNAIVWTAGREVPMTGVQTEIPDLSQFKPASIEPMPRSK